MRHLTSTLPIVCVVALVSGLTALVRTASTKMIAVHIPLVATDTLVEGFQTFGRTRFPWSRPQLLEFMAGAKGWTVTGTANWPVTIETPNRREAVQVEAVVANYLDVAGVGVARGRWFTASENEVPVRDFALVLSESLCRRGFERPEDCLGGEVRIGTDAYTVIGTMPIGFRGLDGRTEVWAPIMMVPAWMPPGKGLPLLQAAYTTWLALYGRLGDGIDVGDAQRDLRRLARAMASRLGWAEVYTKAHRWPRYEVMSVDESRTDPRIVRAGNVLQVALVVLAVMALLNGGLLVAGIIRSESHGTAVRIALGATTSHLLRRLVGRGAVGGATAGVFAWLLTSGALWALWYANDRVDILKLPGVEIPLSELVPSRVEAATIAGGLFVLIVLAGSARLWVVGRRGQGGLLRNETQIGVTRRGRRGESALLVVQVGCAVALGTWATLLARTYDNAVRIPLGFRADDVIVLRLPAGGHLAAPDLARMATVVEETPGVAAAGRLDCLPLSNACRSTTVALDEDDGGAPGPTIGAIANRLDPLVATTVGMELIAGRLLDERDTVSPDRAAVVSEEMARALRLGPSPIGRAIRIASAAGGPFAIVGVVRDVKYRGILERVTPVVYIPVPASSGDSRVFVIRPRAPVDAVVTNLRDALATAGFELEANGLVPLARLVRQGTVQQRVQVMFFVAFAAVGLAVTLLGVAATTALTVTRRMHEIGIRLAVGATAASEVARITMLVGRYVGYGALAGVAMAALTSRALEPMLFGVQPREPSVMAASAAIVAVTCLVCAYRIARRAALVDPAANLRKPG